MVMTDDPFSDPLAFDDLLNELDRTTMTDSGSTENSQATLQNFMTVFLGLPLAVWGGYTLIRDAMKAKETVAARPVSIRRRRRRVPEAKAKPADDPEEADADEPVPSDGNTDSTTQPEQTVQEDESSGVFEAEVEAGPSVDAELEPSAENEEGELEEPVISVHPEIAYAQSIVLEPYREGVDPGPQTAFVIEATPVGLVAMGYDFEEKRWIYWANLTPHFRVLDAVARVYVNIHNRHPLYIPPAVADAANEAVDKAEAEGGGGQEGEQLAQDSKASLFITPTPVGAAEMPRPEKRHVANSFKRQGMLSELRFIPEGPREAPKKTSYADFLSKQKAPVSVSAPAAAAPPLA